MKKLLLGTTALIGAVALFAGAANAENPKVTLGGFATFEAGFVSDDLTSEGTPGDNQRTTGFRNDTEISIHVDGKTDAGLGYGAVIDLEADVSDDSKSQGSNAARTYVYLDGGWGRVELGSTEGPQDTLKVDAASIARATGGIDGDWTYFANSGGLFLATPDLVTAYGAINLGDESQNNLTKIAYYSPRFSGFQFGISYAPDATDRGQVVTRTDNVDAQFGDIIDGAVSYQGQWNQISLGASLTGEFANSDTSVTEDVKAWAAGAKLGWLGWSAAGSYGSWDDSNQTSSSDDNTDYWTLGAAYETGPYGISLTYLNSTRDVGATENDLENYVIGADYKLAEGLTPFVEVSFYDQEVGANAALDNDGTVGIVGIDFNF